MNIANLLATFELKQDSYYLAEYMSWSDCKKGIKISCLAFTNVQSEIAEYRNLHFHTSQLHAHFTE